MLRKTVVGAISAVTSCAVISLFGAGIANASVTVPDTAAASSHNPAVAGYAHRVQQLHDQLGKAVEEGNVDGVKTTVHQLSTVLGKLKARGPRAIGADASSAADKAATQNAKVANKLSELPETPSGNTPDALPVPGPSGPLGMLSGLLQSLLSSLQSLVASLLGGGLPAPPVPVPTPPVPTPPVPVPPVPGS